MEKPILVSSNYQLKKMTGKGGWTYIEITEIEKSKRGHFGMIKVCGSIDHYELKATNLMPMGNGNMFLPVKAEIRKNINKTEGDTVKLILFANDPPLITHEEFLLCLEEEPTALKNFNLFTEIEQNKYIDWIYSAKNEETKIERIVMAIDLIVLNIKFVSPKK